MLLTLLPCHSTLWVYNHKLKGLVGDSIIFLLFAKYDNIPYVRTATYTDNI